MHSVGRPMCYAVTTFSAFHKEVLRRPDVSTILSVSIRIEFYRHTQRLLQRFVSYWCKDIYGSLLSKLLSVNFAIRSFFEYHMACLPFQWQTSLIITAHSKAVANYLQYINQETNWKTFRTFKKLYFYNV